MVKMKLQTVEYFNGCFVKSVDDKEQGTFYGRLWIHIEGKKRNIVWKRRIGGRNNGNKNKTKSIIKNLKDLFI